MNQFKDQGSLTKEIKFFPSEVRIPFSQHIGSPAIPIVDQGDSVNCGDLVAQASGNVSSNIHASISGKILRVNQKEIVIKG